LREHKNRLRRHSRKTPPPDGTRKARGTAHRIDEIEERSADDPQQRGCVQINAAAELGPHYPEFGQEIAARLDELQGFSRSMIARARAEGLKYSFTLHDLDGARLLGFDNAHGLPRVQAYDHRHRFERTGDLVPYKFQDADTLLVDFFDAVEQACKQSDVAFEFDPDEVEVEAEEDDDDGTQITG
jgi:hypothetical protein